MLEDERSAAIDTGKRLDAEPCGVSRGVDIGGYSTSRRRCSL